MSAAATPYAGILSSLIGSLQAPRTPTFGNNPIAGAFAHAQDQANQGNAQRGGAILQLLSQQGQSQLAANQQQFQGEVAAGDQNLMNRGLYNTTISENFRQGANRDLMLANENVNERTAGNLASTAERFSQTGPNMNLMASLLERGGGSGGGIVSGPGSSQLNLSGVGQMFNPWEGQGY